MRVLKDFFSLALWLFTSRPSDVVFDKIDVLTMKHFPFRGYRYMAWCGRIITREDREGVIKRFLSTKMGRESLIHEMGHVVQAVYEHGDNWFRFYWMYFINWIKHNPLTHPSHAAYYCNRYEVEAYAQQHNPDYWNNYSRYNLKGKYSIKHAKSKFKQCGSVKNWKQYIKEL